ncbi:MAG: hypothetical protein AB7F51_13225 [Pseudorhodoplanes sp.]
MPPRPQTVLAVVLAAGAVLASFPAAAIGPPPSMPRVLSIRVDPYRPGEMPGAPRNIASPKEQFMLAPAQPETTAPRRKKRSGPYP